MRTGKHNTEPGALRAEGLARSSAFTLVEVLVAVVILSVSIVAVLSVFSHSVHAFGEARNVLRADLLIMNRLAELELAAVRDGKLEGGESSGAFGDENSGYLWECRIAQVSEPKTMAPGEPVLNQVDLQVWREGSERRVSVSTFIRTVMKQ